MDEIRQTSNSENEESRKLKGLYKGVNVSVKALNIVIIACVLLIIVLVAMDLRDPGLTVSFDSLGGSDVASQQQMYGELLQLPDPPSREGYTFTGWYKDYACFEPWNDTTDTIQSDMTLYAGWQKLQ
ncbi:MAG: InlB B-repeat-containing protein [Oscillospiraceae bacterium]|nr:InlB B-repeat-containing protein [Oscillospiraceae bacterium]